MARERDWLQLAERALRDLGLRGAVDRLRGEIVVQFSPQGVPAELVVLRVTPRGVTIRAPRIAGTGGPDGRVDHDLAATAAMLAYDTGLLVGVDKRDGEIEARACVELARVRASERRAVLRDALREFFDQQRFVRDILTGQRTTRAPSDDLLSIGEPVEFAA